MLGRLKLQAIAYEHIQNFVNDMVDHEYSPPTVHLMYRILYDSLQKACQRKIIKENPAQDVTLPKKRKREMAFWTLNQVNYFSNGKRSIARPTIATMTSFYPPVKVHQ